MALTVGLRLDEETQRRLKELAQVRDRTPHYLMKEAVTKYLEGEELIEAEKAILIARWEQYEITGEAIDHEDVKSWAAKLTSHPSSDEPR